MNLRTRLVVSSFLALGLSSSALAGWGDATGGGGGSGSAIDPSLREVSLTNVSISAPFTVVGRTGTQIEITQSGGGSSAQLSSINIVNEGHGWAALRFNLSNGDAALFHTGLNIYQSELLFDRAVSLTPTTTKQPVGLQGRLIDKQEHTDFETTEESCQRETTEKHCYYNHQTHQQWCVDETTYSTGKKEVTVWTTDSTYTTRFDLVAANSATSVGSVDVTTRYHEVMKTGGYICKPL
jgi:hypothetical protein